MTHSPLINGVQITSDSSSRGGSRVDRFIVHHAATTSLAAILSLFQPGGRTVSANYALGSDGTLILAVDEDRRAWTSASAYWDGRAVTIEVANSQAGGSWPVSDASFDKLARLIADVSLRHGFGINDDTILTHQELYRRYGDSYATACPGDLQRRKAELIGKANYYRAFGPSAPAGSDPKPLPIPKQEKEMIVYANIDTNVWKAGVLFGGVWVDVPAGQGDAWVAASGRELVKLKDADFKLTAALARQKADGDVHVYANVETNGWRLIGPGVDYAIGPGEQAIFEAQFGTRVAVSNADMERLRRAFGNA